MSRFLHRRSLLAGSLAAAALAGCAGLAAAQSPSPEPALASTYALQGSTSLNTLTRGTVPLAGLATITPGSEPGAYGGDLGLADAPARLRVIGLLPVTATLSFQPGLPATATLRGGQLSVSQQLKIVLRRPLLFGAIPIAGATSCQTRRLSTVALHSTQARFEPSVGGPTAGTYALSDLTGCGSLNGVVSPLVAGGGNTIGLTLTPAGPPVPTPTPTPSPTPTPLPERLLLTVLPEDAGQSLLRVSWNPVGAANYKVSVEGRLTAETSSTSAVVARQWDLPSNTFSVVAYDANGNAFAQGSLRVPFPIPSLTPTPAPLP